MIKSFKCQKQISYMNPVEDFPVTGKIFRVLGKGTVLQRKTG